MTYRKPRGRSKKDEDRRRTRRRNLQLLRQACYAVVYARAAGRCERCGIAVSGKRPKGHPQRAHMNHKQPLSLGGQDDPDNCELICQSCHMPRGEHAPTAERQAELQRTREPRGL